LAGLQAVQAWARQILAPADLARAALQELQEGPPALPDQAQKAWDRLILARANSGVQAAKLVELVELVKAWARKTLVRANLAKAAGMLVEQGEAWARKTLVRVNLAKAAGRPVEQGEAWARKTLVRVNLVKAAERLAEQARAWARKTSARDNLVNLAVPAAHQQLEINWDSRILELKAWAAPVVAVVPVEAVALACLATSAVWGRAWAAALAAILGVAAAARQVGRLVQLCKIMCLFHLKVVRLGVLVLVRLRLGAVERPADHLQAALLVTLQPQQPE
jgi:hypothetical protein